MKRIAAHKLTFQGKSYSLSVIELTSEGEIRIYPLTEELPFTSFYNGHIHVELTDGDLNISGAS